jgi:hypothetical protein
LKLKRIMSLFTTIALLAGLFATPAFAGENSWQSTPPLQSFLNILGQQYSPSMTLPDGTIAWARFDRGQLVYGFPWNVTSSDQEWKQASADVYGDDWDTANALDSLQASSGSVWASGLQFTGSHPGQEPRYIGYDVNGIEISNENFPIDASSNPIPAQCQMIERPWTSVSEDPNKENRSGSGWPGRDNDPSAVPDYAWGVIEGAIQDCYKQFGFTVATDSFAENSSFSAQNGGLSPTNIENSFELLTMPEPGITGSVRFWHYIDGSPYYKTISIPWTVLPNYYVESIEPFGTSDTTTAQYGGGSYTGTVTFGLEPDPMNSSNAGSVTYQLWQLMSLPDTLSPVDIYSAPVGVCVNAQDNFATIITNSTFLAVPAGENAGGPNEGITLGNLSEGVAPGTYTATFSWSVPSSFSGTSMPIGAGINDGYNDSFNQTTDIIPDDITTMCADPYEADMGDNYMTVTVPVSGATQPALVVTPASATVNVRSTQQFTDTYYPGGLSQGNGQVVTAQSAWSDNDSSVATIGPGNGLATGVSQGSANITASYTPPAGNALNGSATLAVQAQQPPPTGSYSGTLSFQAVNQANIQTLYGRQVGGTLKRGPNIALWTDTVTATLKALQQPDVSPYVPAGGVVTGVTWSISKATLTYPAQNPDYIFDNPVEPAATASTGLTPSGHQATASFEENWSEDGIGYGSSGPCGIYDTLTGSMIAATPKSYSLSATFTLDGTVSGYVPTREPYGDDGWRTVDIPFGPVNFTVNGTASQPLWVCGTGAVPVTGTGGHLAVVACLANPQTHP